MNTLTQAEKRATKMTEKQEPKEEKNETVEEQTVETLARITGQIRTKPRNPQTKELLRQTWQGTVSRMTVERKASATGLLAEIEKTSQTIRTYLGLKLVIIAI
jgi:hypothetical protein